MNATRIIATAGAVLALAACSSPGTAHAHSAAAAVTTAASASPTAPASSSPPLPDTGTTDGSPFTCSTVVDSADSTSPFKVLADGGSITAQDAIAYLEALEVADVVNLSVGTVNATAAAILDGAQQDLMNYHADKLADDAAQFSSDEQSYSPDGPVDTSYWPAVQSDITALGKDCPKALAEAMRIDNGGGS